MFKALIIFSLWLLPTSDGSSDCSLCDVYEGYVTGNIVMWGRGMTHAEEELIRKDDNCLLFSVAEARYGYIGYLLRQERKEEAKVQIEKLEKEAVKLSGADGYHAEADAFLIAVYGFMMEISPARSMTLGPKALRLLNRAMESGDECPSLWVEKGNSELHMPAFAGGSDVKAAESFRRAIALWEASPGSQRCNWRYLNALVLLGGTLEKNGDRAGAREAYMKALALEPGFILVRDELLPGLENPEHRR